MEKAALWLLCLALMLPLCCLTSEDDYRRLTAITDLRNINPGHVFPRHGLMLLYFLAINVEIDQNNVIRPLMRPNMQAYGFHYYGDREGIFPPLPDQNNMAYYSLGNLRAQGAEYLPAEVFQNFNQRPFDQNSNRDRIVVSYHRNRHVLVDIYITQHLPPQQGSYYDPANTFRITPDLLRAIQSLHRNNEYGLYVFLSLAGYIYNGFTSTCHVISAPHVSAIAKDQGCEAEKGSSQNNVFCEETEKSSVEKSITVDQKATLDNREECSKIVLEVKTTFAGYYARIKWDNLPVTLRNGQAKLVLYQNSDMEQTIYTNNGGYGITDTSVAFNPGLQLKLMSADGSLIMSGTETDDADRHIPVDIRGHDASLQLYAKDGYAGARLYIKKTFTDWKTVFKYSWVAFYFTGDIRDELRSSPYDNDDYYTWKWAIDFTKAGDNTIPDYDIYYYLSSMYIHPMAQARFFLTKKTDSDGAHSALWED